MAKPIPRLGPAEIAAIVATAWSDASPFDAVLMRHGLTPGQLVALLKRELTPTAYRTWANRGSGARRPTTAASAASPSPAAPARGKARR
jgi:uncharacterized protein (TIGR03643 family)